MKKATSRANEKKKLQISGKVKKCQKVARRQHQLEEKKNESLAL